MLNQSVSGKTVICGVIGDPVEHTLSPVIQNAAFKALELDYIYVPFRVHKSDLSKAIYGIRALNIKGVNVTIPHKIAVTAMLDELDPMAMKIGAVNTIVNNNGTLKGYNTDAPGFIRPLLERVSKLQGKQVVVLGAGGAARAICFALAEQKSGITILNRTVSRAKELADEISTSREAVVTGAELNRKNLEESLQKADILVNTTSIGMHPDTGNTPVSPDLIARELIVYDIVYNPVKTGLIMAAEKAGAITITGLEMLLGQGALSFELWTGQKAPAQLMREKLIEALKAHET